MNVSRFASLDGVRALSIGLVLFSHELGQPGFWTSDQLHLTGRGNLGIFGVRIFFIISGFLITSLLLREYDATGHVSIPRFYLRRTFRILPAFLALLATLAALSVLGWIHLRQYDLLRAATFSINFFYGSG